ncbi:MAG: trypsin-like peptidase domain-containing protein [Acidobacteriota bacterium]
MNRRNWIRSHSGLTFMALLITLALGITIGSIVSDRVESAAQQVNKAAQLAFEKGDSAAASVDAVSLQQTFRKVAETIEPAVVNISTQSIIETAGRRNPHPEALRDFFGDEFWQRFFGSPDGGPTRQKRDSLGSGVIVDAKGYILTNYHVAAPIPEQGGSMRRLADRIDVQLQGGSTYEAKIVGVDPESDLAVLKIEAKKPLPAAKIGDSANLQVGDWVIAVGSPFGFEQTVTAGIVSATKRVVPGTNSFGDYIQTDAAINPGNSGGPLVNLKGEVVGINSFITTRTGQFAGIGFAIPSVVFLNSYNQLITEGKIQRGWLGVSMNTFPMTPELARYFGVAGKDSDGVKDGDGVVVTQLIGESGEPSDSGPAAKAGIKPEDVIVKFGDREIEDLWDLRTAVANTTPGKTVPVTLVRKGQIVQTNVQLAERMIEEKQRAESEGLSFEDQPEEQEKPKEIGLTFETLTAKEASDHKLDDQKGVLIIEVTPGSLADDAGLTPDMVVTAVNGKSVTTAQGFKDAVTAVSSGQGVVLRVVYAQAAQQGVQTGVAYTSFIKP